MKALGITDGIGSLLYGPKKLGFEILGNYEWRKYYNTGTFEKNFKAPYITDYDQKFPSWKGLDLVCSHPECGNYSNLYTGKNAATRNMDPGDIYKFIDLCSYYKPKYFICDNLPKSLLAVTPTNWREQLKSYNLDFCWVSNWGYGNTQRQRKRLFIIGVHKDLKWKFVPQEFEHQFLLEDAIGSIKRSDPDHQIMSLDDWTQWSWYQTGRANKEGRMRLKDLQKFLSSMDWSKNMPYYNRAGELKSKPGYSIVNPEKPSPVLSGGGGFYDNHWIFDTDRNYYRPLTMRERLSIQGFQNDFSLSGSDFEYGTKMHQYMIKQTGKCMPVEFPTEFARQILKGNSRLKESRVDTPPQIVIEANQK